MMYDFNIIVNPDTDHKEKHSFTFDGDNGIYQWTTGFNKNTGHKNYLLSDDDCRLLVKAGGVNGISSFLRNSGYGDVLKVNGLKIVNCNP